MLRSDCISSAKIPDFAGVIEFDWRASSILNPFAVSPGMRRPVSFDRDRSIDSRRWYLGVAAGETPHTNPYRLPFAEFFRELRQCRF
jgi:hypothetical protein